MISSICGFGCGNPATHVFKTSGKACCSKVTSSCPAMKLKNSNASAKKKFDKLDWVSVQKDHDSGLSLRALVAKYQVSESVFTTAQKHGVFRIRSRAEYSRLRIGKCFISTEAKDKLARLAKERTLGGYVPRSGRGKKGWFRGIWCDSSWELAWVIYATDHGIGFVKNTVKFDYTFKGKHLKYIPDFLLDDGTYVEIKGYETEQVSAKISSFPHQITLIGRASITKYLNYAIEKYGVNFTNQYETGELPELV